LRVNSSEPKKPCNGWWVEIPHARGHFLGVVRLFEKHWETAKVYAAKGIVQSSIMARHVMRPFAKILDFNIVTHRKELKVAGTHTR